MSQQFNQTNKEYYPVEKHDTLLGFTVGAILVGLITTLATIGPLLEDWHVLLDWHTLLEENGWQVIALTLASMLVVVGGIYTLIATKGFTYWNHGITPAERAIGTIVVIIGFLTTFWLVIFILVAIGAARANRE